MDREIIYVYIYIYILYNIYIYLVEGEGEGEATSDPFLGPCYDLFVVSFATNGGFARFARSPLEDGNIHAMASSSSAAAF